MKPSDYVKKGWCRGASAMDEHDVVTYPEGPLARKWCLYGSLCAAYPNDTLERMRVIEKLGTHIGQVGLGVWNDEPGRTQQEVIKLLESIGE